MLGHLYRSVGTMVSLTGSSSDLHNYAALPASVQEALPPTPSPTPHMPSTPEPPRARVASLKTQNVREVRPCTRTLPSRLLMCACVCRVCVYVCMCMCVALHCL